MNALVGVSAARGAEDRLRPYLAALEGAGAAAVLVRPGANSLERIGGLLLPGGPDVAPGRYGQAPRPWLGQVHPELDEFELSLVAHARACALPVLAICRGLQVVNVSLGGTLFQDLRAEGATMEEHAVPRERGLDLIAHSLVVEPQTRLREIAGAARVPANSRHHQAVREVAPGLTVSARSPDGVVEALESADGMILALQCHPEDLVGGHPWARRLFQAFVTLVRGD
jgi:putative glutamine amidotransferase